MMAVMMMMMVMMMMTVMTILTVMMVMVLATNLMINVLFLRLQVRLRWRSNSSPELICDFFIFLYLEYHDHNIYRYDRYCDRHYIYMIKRVITI